jgi:hypothetical protein
MQRRGHNHIIPLRHFPKEHVWVEVGSSGSGHLEIEKFNERAIFKNFTCIYGLWATFFLFLKKIIGYSPT